MIAGSVGRADLGARAVAKLGCSGRPLRDAVPEPVAQRLARGFELGPGPAIRELVIRGPLQQTIRRPDARSAPDPSPDRTRKIGMWGSCARRRLDQADGIGDAAHGVAGDVVGNEHDGLVAATQVLPDARDAAVGTLEDVNPLEDRPQNGFLPFEGGEVGIDEDEGREVGRRRDLRDVGPFPRRGLACRGDGFFVPLAGSASALRSSRTQTRPSRPAPRRPRSRTPERPRRTGVDAAVSSTAAGSASGGRELRGVLGDRLLDGEIRDSRGRGGFPHRRQSQRIGDPRATRFRV